MRVVVRQGFYCMTIWDSNVPTPCLLTQSVIDEVVNIIKSCKPKHSKDCDDINMYVLSKVTDQIVKPLVHIFNLSFSSGIFPSEMKTAKVIPVFKSGNRSDFSNYRPISLLSQFSKIL